MHVRTETQGVPEHGEEGLPLGGSGESPVPRPPRVDDARDRG